MSKRIKICSILVLMVISLIGVPSVSASTVEEGFFEITIEGLPDANNAGLVLSPVLKVKSNYTKDAYVDIYASDIFTGVNGGMYWYDRDYIMADGYFGASVLYIDGLNFEAKLNKGQISEFPFTVSLPAEMKEEFYIAISVGNENSGYSTEIVKLNSPVIEEPSLVDVSDMKFNEDNNSVEGYITNISRKSVGGIFSITLENSTGDTYNSYVEIKDIIPNQRAFVNAKFSQDIPANAYNIMTTLSLEGRNMPFDFLDDTVGLVGDKDAVDSYEEIIVTDQSSVTSDLAWWRILLAILIPICVISFFIYRSRKSE